MSRSLHENTDVIMSSIIHDLPLMTLNDLSTGNLSLEEAPNAVFKKDKKFYLVFFAICVASFLAAIDLTAISTLIPSISFSFEKGYAYSWIPTSYAITAVAFIPLTGGLSDILGRKPVMLGALILFAIGSIIVASASLMSTAIFGRTLQGVGGGGILTMTEILVVDTIPLGERGLFFGLIGSVWAFSCAVGPLVAGALVNDDSEDSTENWRYLFWGNVPFTAFTIVVVYFCLDYVKAPATTWREKIHQMDFVNILFLTSTASTMYGVTVAGEDHEWYSVNVLLPLLLGITGIVLYFVIQKVWVTYPTVPFAIMRNKTSVLGYVCNTLHGIVFVMGGAYYLPLYFQAVLAMSSFQSGLYLFAINMIIAPVSIIAGYIIGRVGRYKIVTLVGWSFTLLGLGLSVTLDGNSTAAKYFGYLILLGIGLSINFSAATFPVLAPLHQTQQPPAVAFLAFSRAFGAVLGLALGGTVLNRSLLTTLPDYYLDGLTEIGGKIDAVNSLAYIAVIKYLEDDQKSEVQAGFAKSLQQLWYGCLACAGLGLVLSVFMREFKLSKDVSIDGWGFKESLEEGKDELEEEK